jgi:hypothetical protein
VHLALIQESTRHESSHQRYLRLVRQYGTRRLPDAVQSAVSFFEQNFTNNVTLNITFGWTALGAGVAAQNSFYYDTYTYSQMKARLTASATSADDSTAYATLPASDPTPGGE